MRKNISANDTGTTGYPQAGGEMNIDSDLITYTKLIWNAKLFAKAKTIKLLGEKNGGNFF